MPTPMSLAILPNDEQPPVDERPISEIIALLRTGPVRATDVARLSDLDRAGAGALAEAWPRYDEATRIAIVRLMEALAEERVELIFSRALRPALEDDSPVVRQVAIAALWEDASTDLLDRLLNMLESDPSIDARAEAAKGLGHFAALAAADELDDTQADALRARLLDAATDPEQTSVIQRRAIEAVGAFGKDDEVREAIETAHGSEDQSMQASALFAMGRSHDPYWLDLLLGELASGEAELRFEAARACGLVGHDDLVPELIALCDDEDMEVRHAAITSLGQIGGRAAVRVLESLAAAADAAEATADLELIAAAIEEAQLNVEQPRGGL